MTLIDIAAEPKQLDNVLITCLLSGIFQPEYASKLSEYSIGQNSLSRNPYVDLLEKISSLTGLLNISVKYDNSAEAAIQAQNHEILTEGISASLNSIKLEYESILQKEVYLCERLDSLESIVEITSRAELANLNDNDFEKLSHSKFLKVNLGLVPRASVDKIKQNFTELFEFVPLRFDGDHAWCIYFTSGEFSDKVDDIFKSYGFERKTIPEFMRSGEELSAQNIAVIIKSINADLKALREEKAGFALQRQAELTEFYSIVKVLFDAYALRKYAVSVHGRFHIVGFVPTDKKDSLLAQIKAMDNTEFIEEPAGTDPRLSVPVKLKNNWFAKPFEMFVEMYGLPSYSEIDPTPYLAYTYTLLFGIMFGDLGHGFCVWILGLIAWKLKQVRLGAIMARIGVSSMVFGFCYGSVFGFENLLDPIFNAMGFHEKPIEVMHSQTTNWILIVAVAVGIIIILASILFNVVVGVKKRDYNRVFLSPNGVSGFVFYAAVIAMVLLSMFAGFNFKPWYALLFIALPLIFIFFREPISHFASYIKKDSEISHDKSISHSVLENSSFSVPELFSSKFMCARFGRIPTDSYRKLNFYQNEPFVLYPVKTDGDYIWLIYACALTDKDEIDAIFHDIYFERIYIPDESMQSPEKAATFIRLCVENGAPPQEAMCVQKYGEVEAAKKRTLLQRIFPEGFGAFFVETFFEMFEVILSFISNTVSFLRVGGFVLVHAGMMSVVMTLSQMAGSVGNIAIIIIGNIFVMLIEGLIVGIQVLRLEYYEMFSRFFGSTGDAFEPVKLDE